MRRSAAVSLTFALIATLVATPDVDAVGLDGVDAWSPTVTMRTPDGWYAQPIHGTLMPDGTVMFFGIKRDTWPPSAAGDQLEDYAFTFVPDSADAGLPSEIVTNELVAPTELTGWTSGTGITVNDDFTCAGHTLTADGQLFTAGGTRRYSDGTNEVIRGLPTQTLYGDAGWNRTGDMTTVATLDQAYRWYPSATRLPDTRILVTGGFEQVVPNPAVNVSTEVFDPATNTSTNASPFGATPVEIWQSDYTHVFVLPYAGTFFDIVMFGERGIPIMNSSTSLASWEVRPDQIRPGATGGGDTNNGTSSVMLPIRLVNGQHGYANGSIMMAAGGKSTTFINQADIYDPVLQRWSPSIDLGTPRHHPDTVLLPDGRILIVAGHNVVGNDGVLRAQYIDPQNNFVVTEGTASAEQVRGYHSVALLLPDGRVLIAGGRDSVTGETDEKPSYQYYEPDYLNHPRPQIVEASTTLVGYQDTFELSSNGAEPVEAVMVSLGSMTHSYDMNQRLIQLDISVSEGAATNYLATVTSPPDTNVAPPGDYMLFILDANRIPSEALMMRVVDE